MGTDLQKGKWGWGGGCSLEGLRSEADDYLGALREEV